MIPYDEFIRLDLMKNYNRISRPVRNMSEAVNVAIAPVLYTILEVVRIIHQKSDTNYRTHGKGGFQGFKPPWNQKLKIYAR